MARPFRNVFVPVGLIFSLFVGLGAAASEAPMPAGLEKVLKRSCLTAGCHTGKHPAMGLDLGPAGFAGRVVGVPSAAVPEAKLIDPENPGRSYLLKKIKGDADIQGGRMPLGKAPLTAEEIKLFVDYAEAARLKTSAGREAEGPPVNPAAPAAHPSGRSPRRPAFWGTRLANLLTTTTPGQGEFLFRISHRYQPSLSAKGAFFGLDGPSTIALSFGYGISDRLALTVGRTNLLKTVEIGADWAAFAETSKSAGPFSAVLHLGAGLVTQNLPGEITFQSGHWKFHMQASLSYQVSDRLSLLLAPAYVTNANHWETDSRGTLTLGLGGRFMILDEISVIAEWTPVLAGYADDFAGWAIGFEKKIGGHVFQLFVLNSFGLTADQYLPGGDLRLGDGDLRIGFNIFRTF